MPPFTAFQKSRFSEVSGTLRQGPWGPSEVEMTKVFQILTWLDQTLQATPHMPPFTAFQKSRFSEVSGTLRQGPWGPGEVETAKFFQILNGLDQTLPMTPFCYI